jgi:outer membrane protein assembly factor BamA
VSADYRNEHFRTKGILGKYVNLHYQQIKANAYISEFHLLNFSTSVGVSYIYTAYDKSSFENSPFDSVYYANNAMLAPFVKFQYDNLDDAYFANHGILANLGTHFYYMPSNKDKYFDISYAFQSYITPNEGRFTIIPQVYGRFATHIDPFSSPVQYYNLKNSCGGEIAGRHFENQMPFIGLTSVEDLFGTQKENASILRCDLRYNFYGKHYLTAMYNIAVPWGILGAGGTIFTDLFSFLSHGAGLKYSYNSFLGPISLTAHWVNTDDNNHFGAYFSFGYTF